MAIRPVFMISLDQRVSVREGRKQGLLEKVLEDLWSNCKIKEETYA